MATPLSSPSKEKVYSEALKLSQKAPQDLEKQLNAQALPHIPFWSAAESPELWIKNEKFLLSCLQTGDDKSAYMCLERLIARFGASNERVMALRGLYQEATAKDRAGLENILKEYERILQEDSANTPVKKRRIALLQTLARPVEAISALTGLLEMSPTDIEAWAELSDLYFAQLMYSQARFCLEEVLLITPNAWNIHARLGEISYVSSFSSTNIGDAQIEVLVDGIRRYCRSIELCEGYLRGYYGLKLTTDRLKEISFQDASTKSAVGIARPSQLSHSTIEPLSEKATARIAEIVRRRAIGDPEYIGYDESEVISAKKLLNRMSSDTPK